MKKITLVALFLSLGLLLSACANNKGNTEHTEHTEHTENTESTDEILDSSTDQIEDTENRDEVSSEDDQENNGNTEEEHEHIWNEATCTEPKFCDICGKTVGNALEHSWDNGITIEEPTEESDGEKLYTCYVCNETMTQIIPNKNHEHNYTETQVFQATCTEGGYTTYYCLCGENYKEDYVQAIGHAWKAATCTAAKICTVCEITEGSAKGHNWKAATCTTAKTCTTCGTTEGSAKGHNWKAATCTTPKTCTTCGATEGNAKGHSWGSSTGLSSKPCTTCGATPSSPYGYSKLPKQAMKTLYEQMYAACEEFTTNKGTVTATNGKFVIKKISLDLSTLTVNEAVATWKIFEIENPQFYWLSNTVQVTGNTLELCIDGLYANGEYRTKCDTAIAGMVTDCSKVLTSGMKEVEKAMAIHDFIIGRMNYAYEADGCTPEADIWAHNMTGCAERKSGVCESYAKTYYYLCKLNGIECIMVTGYIGEGKHAWNLVKIQGQWYGVDCTADDNGTDILLYLNFGMNEDKMNENHRIETPQEEGEDYLYPLPSLAEHSIAVVELYKNGGFVDTYLNIDAAFAAMTDRNGEYEVRLKKYDLVGPLLWSSDAVEYHIAATKTPVVKSITLRGNVIDAGNGYATATSLYIDHTLELQCHLQIYDSIIAGEGSLDLKSKKLSLQGKLVTMYIPIMGSLDSKAPSEMYVGVEGNGRNVEFNGSVKVHTISEKNENISPFLFRGDTEIVKAKVHQVKVLLWEGSVHIQEYCPPETDSIALISIESEGNVKVDKITSNREYVSIDCRFRTLEEYPTLTIGSSNTKVRLALDGKMTIVVTDINGNEVSRYTESVRPEDLTVPVATLLDKKVMDKMEIYFIHWIENVGGDHINHTDEYMLNSKNQIVRK